VADPLVTAGDLTRLLERLTVERGQAQSPAQAADAQVERLAARITLLTEALRGAEASDASRLAARLLVADLAQVTAQFRGRTNGIRAALESAVEEMRAAIGADRAAADPPA
jgi:DNA anti-recombination protein RmuC